MRSAGLGVGYALRVRVFVACVRACFLACFLACIVSNSAFAGTEHAGTAAISPISTAFCDEMRAHHVINGEPKVGCDRLRLVKFSYFGFDGKIHEDGEMVVMDAAASHVLRVFENLRKMQFPIFKARPIDEYDGDDDASMRANNSSAFNDRKLTGGSVPSLHAYGLAIDVNPVQNPFLALSDATVKVDPPAGADYLNRMGERPGKPPRRGMAEAVVRVFADEGFLIWGGYWDNPIDYQHFQVSRQLAERLARLSPAEAASAFDEVVGRYRACEAKHRRQALPNPECLIRADPAVEQLVSASATRSR